MATPRPSKSDSKRTRIIFATILFGTAAWAIGAEPGSGAGAHAASPGVGHPAAPSVSEASHSEPAASGVHTGTGNNGTSGNAGENAEHSNRATESGSADNRGDHGHQNRERRNSDGYIYYNPWWGSYGWDNGSYGDGFNNGYNMGAIDTPDTTNTNSNNSNNATANSSSNAGVQEPTPSDSQAVAQAQLQNAVDHSPEMVSANNQVQLAQANYDKERQRVLASLAEKPEYKEAMSRRHEAAGDLRTAKLTPTTGPSLTATPAVIDAATAKLDAADDVTKMQEQAIAADPNASDAKARLAQAVADRDSLRANMLAKH